MLSHHSGSSQAVQSNPGVQEIQSRGMSWRVQEASVRQTAINGMMRDKSSKKRLPGMKRWNQVLCGATKVRYIQVRRLTLLSRCRP